MLLMANSSRGDQAAFLKPRKFALRSSRAGARVPNQLGGVEAALRVAEQHTEDALLCLSKQHIRQASSTGLTGASRCTQCGHNHARFGHARQKGDSWPRAVPRSVDCDHGDWHECLDIRLLDFVEPPKGLVWYATFALDRGSDGIPVVLD